KGGEMKQEELVSLTNRLVRNPAIGLFTYHYNFTYCRNCKKSWAEALNRCPSCGSMSTITLINRFQ
ncbi:MAG: anaerobic ribonucleoside-triphosphate reductase, partial [Candidatus Bathyarchaeota archaeon]